MKYQKIESVYCIPMLDLFQLREDPNFSNFVQSTLTQRLTERLMQVLGGKTDIIVKPITFNAQDIPEIGQFKYSKQLEWAPLVRCKDCIHRHQTTCPFLIANAYKVNTDNDFCSRGERTSVGLEDEDAQ